jgi:hypothetical protein
MGTRYELTGPYFEKVPGEAEGFAHWLRCSCEKEACEVGVIIDLWAGLGSQDLICTLDFRVSPYVVMKYGGNVSDWNALLAAGANSSDTDDVIQLLVTEPWGQRALWAAFRAHQGA